MPENGAAVEVRAEELRVRQADLQCPTEANCLDGGRIDGHFLTRAEAIGAEFSVPVGTG